MTLARVWTQGPQSDLPDMAKALVFTKLAHFFQLFPVTYRHLPDRLNRRRFPKQPKIRAKHVLADSWPSVEGIPVTIHRLVEDLLLKRYGVVLGSLLAPCFLAWLASFRNGIRPGSHKHWDFQCDDKIYSPPNSLSAISPVKRKPSDSHSNSSLRRR